MLFRSKPLILTGIFISLARQHFSRADNLREDSLRESLWNPDDTKSKILIESVTRWKTNVVQQRPAIMVKRGNIQLDESLSIGDMYQAHSQTYINRGNKKVVDSGNYFAIMLLSSHTLFCIGNTGAEAETIGTEMYFQLLEFMPIIRDEFNLKRLRVDNLGQVAKLEESSEHWVVPVSVSYAFTHTWSVDKLGPELKSISLAVKA